MIVPWDTVRVAFLSSLCFESLCTSELLSNEALLHTVNMAHMHQNDVHLFHKMTLWNLRGTNVML